MENSEKLIITKNAQETQDLGEEIGKGLKGGEVLALYGELGSGKTTFVQGLARGMGVRGRILSPTFTLVRSHKISHKSMRLYHMDFYRIDSVHEAEALGLKELWADPKNICVIEWAEKIKEILPRKRWDIKFDYLSENERQIEIFK